MRILLLGEYSNVHSTLAKSLRLCGHEVVVASDGDGFKNYTRDIDLRGYRKGQYIFNYVYNLLKGKFSGYDIVQIINYRFYVGQYSETVCEILFNFLKRNNKKVILAAYGDDYFYYKAAQDKLLEYSILDCWHTETVKKLKKLHYSQKAITLNKYIAEKCDGIVSCMYDYNIGYQKLYANKLINIPLPIDLESVPYKKNVLNGIPKIFVGVQENRYTKGSEIILDVLRELLSEKVFKFDLVTVSNIPYHEYLELFDDCNIFFDQIYSYSSGMNGLLALAKGKILFGGGEFESYKILNEFNNQPIVNLKPDKAMIKQQIAEFLKININERYELAGFYSRKFVEDNHNSEIIVDKYVSFYKQILDK